MQRRAIKIGYLLNSLMDKNVVVACKVLSPQTLKENIHLKEIQGQKVIFIKEK